MSTPTTIALKTEADVRTASNLASEMAFKAGFSNNESAELALAVSEISQNVLRYAVSGRATFHSPNGNRIFKVVVTDNGPGIADLEEAMKKGFSTGQSSLGIGLDVAKRSVDEFYITTSEDTGTEVVMKKFLPIPDDAIEYGVVSLADERYTVNGDEFLIKEYDGDKVLLAVIDGVGEGYRAHAAATLVKDYLSAHYRLPLEVLAEKCHQLLRKSDLQRGAAVAIARVASREVSYLGIGDTHAYIIGEEVKYLHNHEGTVGELQLPTLRTRDFTLTSGAMIVLCTDGIKSNLWFDEDPQMSAQQMAKQVFSDYHKSYGDVTVLVAKILNDL